MIVIEALFKVLIGSKKDYKVKLLNELSVFKMRALRSVVSNLPPQWSHAVCELARLSGDENRDTERNIIRVVLVSITYW